MPIPTADAVVLVALFAALFTFVALFILDLFFLYTRRMFWAVGIGLFVVSYPIIWFLFTN